MNINEVGKYYASMVAKSRAEYKSKNLHSVCKKQKINYTKMLYCLRNDSYRKASATPVSLWCVPKVQENSKGQIGRLTRS